MEKLSLIDVSSEDDLLISSSADRRRDPRSSANHGGHNCSVSEPDSAHEGENLLKMSQQLEHVPEMSESPEQKRAKSGEVNLRKSLAWDSAFFTSEGVLNTEELAIVNSTFRKTELCSLPEIQEELRRSTESTSTLDSESYTLESLEGDLFENVRASIQKSLGKQNNCSSGMPAARPGARKKVELPAQTKMKPPIALKRDGANKQQLESTSKESVLCGKETAKGSGDSKMSLKPPRNVPKPASLPTVPSNKDSLGSMQLKSNIRRISSGSGANRLAKTDGDSCNTTSRLRPNPASHLGTVVFSSSSSLSNGSPASSPSHAAGKSPLEPTRKRSATRNSNQTTKTLRVSKSNLGPSNQSRSPTVAHPAFKFPSRASPTSSIESVISEASSSTSASIKPSNSVESLASSTSSSLSLAVSTDTDGYQRADIHTVPTDQSRIRREIPANSLHNRPITKASMGTRALSEPSNRDHTRSSINSNAAPKSSKPSGLRMPSPKIGYFDAEKTLVHNSSKIPQAGARNSLLKGNSGAGDAVGANKPKSSKIPLLRPAAQHVSMNFHAPQARSSSSPRSLRPASPLSLHPQPKPSQVNKESSPATSEGSQSTVCKGPGKYMQSSDAATHKGEQETGLLDEEEKHGQPTYDRGGNVTKESHSVPVEVQKENLFPVHEANCQIQHSPSEYKKTSPVDLMEKLSLLALSETTDLVDGD